MPKIYIYIYIYINMRWLKYVPIKKLNNNKVGKNINSKPNTQKIVI
jgi:hypothetical protein